MTVVLTRPQVQVVPSLAFTVMDFPAVTDWMTPRSKASVLMPFLVWMVNWPSTPRSRKKAKTRRRARRDSLGSPARRATLETWRARAQAGAFPAAPAAAPPVEAPVPVRAAPMVSAPGDDASLSVSLSSAPCDAVPTGPVAAPDEVPGNE